MIRPPPEGGQAEKQLLSQLQNSLRVAEQQIRHLNIGNQQCEGELRGYERGNAKLKEELADTTAALKASQKEVFTLQETKNQLAARVKEVDINASNLHRQVHQERRKSVIMQALALSPAAKAEKARLAQDEATREMLGPLMALRGPTLTALALAEGKAAKLYRMKLSSELETQWDLKAQHETWRVALKKGLGSEWVAVLQDSEELIIPLVETFVEKFERTEMERRAQADTLLRQEQELRVLNARCQELEAKLQENQEAHADSKQKLSRHVRKESRARRSSMRDLDRSSSSSSSSRASVDLRPRRASQQPPLKMVQEIRPRPKSSGAVAAPDKLQRTGTSASTIVSPRSALTTLSPRSPSQIGLANSIRRYSAGKPVSSDAKMIRRQLQGSFSPSKPRSSVALSSLPASSEAVQAKRPVRLPNIISSL